jgi:N-acetylmuramoyl-L-alanine amidase
MNASTSPPSSNGNPPAPTGRPARPSQPTLSTWRALQTVLGVAIVVATLFTLWTPNTLLNNGLTGSVAYALLPNRTPQPVYPTPTSMGKPRIGIVSGHLGNDSGTVCPDGLTEADINLKIATLVKQDLMAQGYDVDLLQEFDTRLFQYQASVLVSIHNDSCAYINDQATGFKVAAAQSTLYPEKAAHLTACLVDRYGKITGLPFHYNSITNDMTKYHAFDEINSVTPAAIIETGFLNLDRQILTQHTDIVAQGVAQGILCFLHNDPVQPTPSPTP